MNGRGEQMDDLIKRQDAITAYCEHECGIKGMTRENCGATDCGTIFDDIPSAQPERKNGKWIRNDNGTYSCSVCQSWIPEEHHYYARYCLYCGAEMERRTDEADYRKE